MSELLLVVISAALVDSIVLARAGEARPAAGGPGQLQAAGVLAAASGAVLTIATGVAWLLDRLVLIPMGLGGARLLAFALIIAVLAALAEGRVRRRAPEVAQRLGPRLPLIAGNCAVLGTVLLVRREQLSLSEALLYGAGVAAGLGILLLCLVAMHDRLNDAAIPAPFRGAGVLLATGGLISLALLGLAGIG